MPAAYFFGLQQDLPHEQPEQLELQLKPLPPEQEHPPFPLRSRTNASTNSTATIASSSQLTAFIFRSSNKAQRKARHAHHKGKHPGDHALENHDA